MVDGTIGAGKKMGTCRYYHMSLRDIVSKKYPPIKKALRILCNNFHLFSIRDITIIKLDTKTDDVAFISSPDFDTLDEPTVGTSERLHLYDKFRFNVKLTRPSGMIYHHKWQFVLPDYKGFDYQKSIERSLAWFGKAEYNYLKIGKRSYWEEIVVPQIERTVE